jgi:hypothetical protein
MTEDEIIEMADKADAEAHNVLGMKGEYHPNWHDVRDEIFAKLVAAKAIAELERQEPVAWGVDWGKAGDIACASIIKRLPNDVIEVVAVEYAPYSYTNPPQRTEQNFCSRCGKRTKDSTHIHTCTPPQD